MFISTNEDSQAETTASLHDLWDAITLEKSRNRQGYKWSPYEGTDLIPAWVADMDIPASTRITESICEFYARGDLGYFDESIYQDLRSVYVRRMERNHDWTPSPELIDLTNDTVQSLHLMVQHHTAPGDQVAVITPVYHHFYSSVLENGRIPVAIPLRRHESGYDLDLELLQHTLRDTKTKLLLLCHPHNPTGKVFSKGDLAQIAQVAAESGVIVVSDEVHADLTYEGGAHIPFALAAAGTNARFITLTSACKAFNIAGTHLGLIVYGDEDLQRTAAGFPTRGYGKPGIAGVIATRTAWATEEPWLNAARDYLRKNRDYFVGRLNAEVPGVKVFSPEATYLAWLDLSAFTDDAHELLLAKARVVSSGGAEFSWPKPTGKEFARINFATSRPVLEAITDRIIESLS